MNFAGQSPQNEWTGYYPTENQAQAKQYRGDYCSPTYPGSKKLNFTGMS